MLISMKRHLLDSLDEQALPWVCIEPVIQQIRGKNFTLKSQVYKDLTAGQRALLMFQVLYGHSRNGIIEFFQHTSYFLSEQGVWDQFKDGMRYFGEDAMLQLIAEMEEIHQGLEARGKHEAIEDIGNDPELFAAIGRIDGKLQEILPETLKRIGSYIRDNPVEFVQIEE